MQLIRQLALILVFGLLAAVALLLSTTGRQGALLVFLVAAPALIIMLIRPFSGLLLVTLIGGLISPKVPVGFANLRFHQAVILILTFAIISAAIVRRRAQEAVGVPTIAILPITSVAISFSMAPNFGEAVKWTLYIAVFFCAFYAARNCLNSWSRMVVFLQAVAAGMVLSAALGFLRLATVGQAITLHLDNPNAFGHFVAMGATFWVAMTMMRTRILNSWFLEIIGLGAVVIAMLASLSRASWLGFAGAMVFLLFNRRQIRLGLMFAIALVVGMALRFTTLSAGIEEKLGEGGQSGITYRMIKAEMAWEMFLDQPLIGQGPGSFIVRASQSKDEAILRHTAMESFYPYVLSEFGLLGVAAFLVGAYLTYDRWRRITRNRKDMRNVLANAVMAVMVGTLFAQVGENTLFFPKVNWMIGFFLAMLFALRRLPAFSLVDYYTYGMPAEEFVETQSRKTPKMDTGPVRPLWEPGD